MFFLHENRVSMEQNRLARIGGGDKAYPNVAKPVNTIKKFRSVPTAGDKIGFKCDMSLNKIWLYFNDELVTLLFENIPCFIIPAISNANSSKYYGIYEIKQTQY